MSEVKELPKGWEIKKLGEVCDVRNGKNQSGVVNPKGKYPIYGSAGIMGFADQYLCEEGCTIIGRKGTINSPIYVKTKFWNIDTAFGLSPYQDLNNRFFYFFCLGFNFKKLDKSTAIPSLTKGNIQQIEIPLPPPSTQAAIVSKIEELFSELDKGVESLRTAQQQLRTYRQSVLKWAFEGRLTEEWRKEQKSLITADKLLVKIRSEREKATGRKAKPLTPITDIEMSELPELPKEWCWVKLGDNAFVTKLAGFEFTKYVKYKDQGDIPVIRAQNVARYSFVPRNFLYVDREIMEQLPRSRVYGGEILMVFVGAGLGNVGIVPENKEFFLGPNVAKIALEKQFINKYIFYFLSSKLGFANVTGMSKATAQGSISMANIREVSVPLNSLEEQRQIVEEIEHRLTVADKMEESISQSLMQSEALRQSILKMAFEGRLVK